jgi:hypothetical protein
MRYVAMVGSLAGTLGFGLLIPQGAVFVALFALCATTSAIGVWDLLQTKHSLRRNYPILANIRFGLEKIRPEIRQYFLESDTDGTPFNRSKRAIAYQRAKGALDKRPFGTQQNIYGDNFEWINHSISPVPADGHDFRVKVRDVECRQPYALSLFNVSAMSFGALSANAIRALNKGSHRRLGGRNRRGAARIRRPCRHAAARGPRSRPQLPGRRGTSRRRSARSEREDRHRIRSRPDSCARRRLVQCGARLHVCARLRPGAVLPYRPALRPKIHGVSGRLSSRTKPPVYANSTGTHWPHWPTWSARPALPTRPSFGPRTSSDASRRAR